MRKEYLIIVMLVLLNSCNNDDSIVMYDNISIQFSLHNTGGDETTVFKSGEDIEMRFFITNMSGKDLSYHYTGVPLIYEIYNSDTVFATSIDGLVFPQVVIGNEIKYGETYQSKWLGPNAPYREPQIQLPVGKYKAYVKHGSFFDDYQIKETSAIEFTIID
ncbi:MAG: hypothetical protein PVH88_27735 [Ignavibacteria bacterium]|jgi:hypothetical protein